MDLPAKVPKKKKALAFLKFTQKPAPSFDDSLEDQDEGTQTRGEDDEDNLTLFKRSKDFFPIVIKEQEEKPRDVRPDPVGDRKHASSDDEEESTPASTRSSKRRRLSSPQPIIGNSESERYSELYGPATPPRPSSKSPSLASRASTAKRSSPTSSWRMEKTTPATGASKGKERVELVESDILPTPSRSNSHQLSARDVVAIEDDEDPFGSNTPDSTSVSAAQAKKRSSPAVEDKSSPSVIDIADSDDDLIETESKPQEDELAYFITRAAEMEAAAKAATAALIPSDDDSVDGAGPSTTDRAHARRKRHEPIIAIKIFVVSRLPGDVLNHKPFGVKRGLNQNLGVVRMGFIQWARKMGMDISLDMERDIFLTWKGRRIYDSATGVSLGWQPTAAGEFPHRMPGFNSGGVVLEAWTMEGFEQYKEAQERQRLIDRGEMTDEGMAAGDSGEAGDTAEEEQEAEVPKIKLSLTEKDTEPLKLSVYADTAIKILIGAYRKQRKVPNDRDIRLQFDGDWLDPGMTVAEADIDDMCTVDVYIR